MADEPRDPRAPRKLELRDVTSRDAAWSEPSKLPDPEPQDGYVYRWIRTSTLGQPDPVNVSTRFREGWEPVPKEEVANLGLMQDHKTRFPEHMEVGGLLLCKMPVERAEARRAHYERLAAQQVAASDHNFLRQARPDPRMPILEPERRTTVTFGSGRPTK